MTELDLSRWPMGPRKVSWDRMANDGISFHGWHLDGVVLNLLHEASHRWCEQCNSGDCIHNAARAVMSIVRMALHDPDCQDCKRFNMGCCDVAPGARVEKRQQPMTEDGEP